MFVIFGCCLWCFLWCLWSFLKIFFNFLLMFFFDVFDFPPKQPLLSPHRFFYSSHVFFQMRFFSFFLVFLLLSFIFIFSVFFLLAFLFMSLVFCLRFHFLFFWKDSLHSGRGRLVATPKFFEVNLAAPKVATKFSMNFGNLDCNTDVQWLCNTWRRSGLKVVHASHVRKKNPRFICTNNEFALLTYSQGKWNIARGTCFE